MKKLTLSVTLAAAIALPTISSGNTLFPDLTFPSDWKTTTSQELVKPKIAIKTVASDE